MTEHESLTVRSIRAVKWNYAGVLGRVAIQFVSQIVLARLLGPDAFGILAFCLLVTGVAYLIAELGLSSAIVQSKQIDSSMVRSAFTWTLMSSVALAIVIVAAAGAIADLLGNGRLEPHLRAMSVGLVFQACGSVSLGLLRRQMDFRSIQVAHVVSQALAYLVVGVGFALAGAGVWSLIIAWITQVSLNTVLLYSRVRHPLAPRLVVPGQGMQVFGTKVLFTNLSNWGVENLDNLLVGKLFGTVSLGLYAVSYNLVRNPTNHMVTALQAVLFSASSRAQDDEAALQRAYLTAMSGVMLVALPLFACAAAVSGLLVRVLYGSAWSDAASILAPLALAMPLHAMTAIAGPVLWGKDMVGAELRIQTSTLVLLGVTLIIAAYHSVVAMAWGVLLVYVVRASWMTMTLAYALGISAGRVLSALRGGAALAAVGILALWSADHITAIEEMIAPIRLALLLLVAAVAISGTLLLIPGAFVTQELVQFLRMLSTRVPDRMRAIVEYALKRCSVTGGVT